MASIYDLKPRFQALLRPAVRRLAGSGVTANQVTAAALVLSLAAGACLALWPRARWPLLAVPAVLFLRMALNAVDGMLAREHGMKSDLGFVLNELGDVLADAAVYLPFALVPGGRAVLVVPLVVLGIAGEMAGVLASQVGGVRRYDGPLGKSDRAFLFGLLGLILGCGVPGGRWLDLALGAAIALAAVTIVRRARRGLQAGGAARAGGAE
jgi:CDP-diacylglycerol--glycerol-3-phosphate 3-phosphatidyltransferase